MATLNNRRRTLGALSTNSKIPLGPPRTHNKAGATAGRRKSLHSSGIPQRRQTLAPNSYSASSRTASSSPGRGRQYRKVRASMGGPRPSLAPMHRQSMAASDRSKSMGTGRRSISRRSSIYRPPGKISDPRDVGKKETTKKHIMLLITYLTTHNYDRQISPKILSAPSSKDFRHIMTFLFRQIDSNFVFATDKFEEQFKNYLKIFCYPFGISKSSLAAVGTPHIWPTILAAVAWIVEFLLYDEEVQKVEEGKDMMAEENANKVFFDYCTTAYKDFLAGVDEYEQLNANLAARFEEKNKVVREDIEKLQQHNQTVTVEIDTLKASESELAELQSKHANLDNELAKSAKNVAALEEEKEMLLKQIRENTAEMETKKEQIISAREEREELSDLLDKQEFSPFEVQSMTHRKEVLQETLASLESEKESLLESIWEQERGVSNKLAEIEKQTRDFNSGMVAIKMLPATAANAGGVDYELEFNAKGRTHLDMASIDLKGFVKPALLSVLEGLAEKNLEAAAELRSLNNRVRNTKDILFEQEEKIASMQARMDKLEDTYRKERSVMNETLKAKVASVEDIELDIHKMKASNANVVANSEAKVAEITAKLSDTRALINKEQQELIDEICDKMDQLTGHKIKVVETLEAVAAETAKVVQTMSR